MLSTRSTTELHPRYGWALGNTFKTEIWFLLGFGNIRNRTLRPQYFHHLKAKPKTGVCLAQRNVLPMPLFAALGPECVHPPLPARKELDEYFPSSLFPSFRFLTFKWLYNWERWTSSVMDLEGEDRRIASSCKTSQNYRVRLYFQNGKKNERELGERLKAVFQIESYGSR